jgi:hypothetical protein
MWEKLANFEVKGLKGYSHMLGGNGASSSTTSYGFTMTSTKIKFRN